MSGATTRDQVIDLVADTLGCDRAAVTEAATMRQLGADSLDVLEVVMVVEDTCAVTITDAEADACTCVGDLIGLVERKRVEA